MLKRLVILSSCFYCLNVQAEIHGTLDSYVSGGIKYDTIAYTENPLVIYNDAMELNPSLLCEDSASNCAFFMDTLTNQKACELLGYTNVVSVSCTFYEKNNVAYDKKRCTWNNSAIHDSVLQYNSDGTWTRHVGFGAYTPDWTQEPYPFISSLTCSRIATTECNDGIDNDGDGTFDDTDPGCYQNGNYNQALDNEAAATNQCL